MSVGILVAGRPPSALAGRFGGYDDMFRTMLGDGFAATAYDVAAGDYPATVADHDAYLITGARAGVYDDLPWIAPLKAFLGAAKGKAKLVGICFGHQIMAEAFGGRVEKSERGWGVGLHRYEILERAPWMDEAASVSLPVSHQDQVVEPPPGARILAGNAFSPHGILAYTDQPAISLQPHPEFEPEFARALIEGRREIVPDADTAIASLDRPNDRARVAGWIRRFLA